MELLLGLGPYIALYALIPIALIVMVRHYEQTNWLWLLLIAGSVMIGVAPFVAGAYLFVTATRPKQQKDQVEYHTDGSYTVYPAAPANEAVSPGKLAFRIIGGLLAGLSVMFGLLFVGIILLFTLLPSVACGGSSKCY